MLDKYKLFSELIVKLKIKPDYQIVSKIDEITLPFQHCKAVKKDINNLFFKCFTEFMEDFKSCQKNRKPDEIPIGTEIKCNLNFVDCEYRINSKKIKRECPRIFEIKHPSFDDRILDDEFVNEINRFLIIKSISFGQAFAKTRQMIKSTEELSKLDEFVLLDEVYFFWTSFFKHDFCYLLPFDIKNQDLSFEEKDIELGILRFYVNQFEKSNIDLSRFTGDKRTVLESVCFDTTNYRWFVIMGFWLGKKESIETNLERLKNCDSQNVETELDNIFNY